MHILDRSKFGANLNPFEIKLIQMAAKWRMRPTSLNPFEIKLIQTLLNDGPASAGL
jgi:hypothetical protein